MITSQIEDTQSKLVEARDSLVAHAQDLARLTETTRMKLPRNILRLAMSYSQSDPRYVYMADRARLEQAITHATLLQSQIIAVRPELAIEIALAIDGMNNDLRTIRAFRIS